MERIAFKMKLFSGFEEEYKKRHDEIWPELVTVLKKAGIADFSIFLDQETQTLFAFLRVDDAAKMKELPADPVQQKWWAWMKDIMQTHADNSPVQVPLQEVFYLP